MITDCFARAAKGFGLTISIKKTEVLKQEHSSTSHETGKINTGDDALQFVVNIISSDESLDEEITHRLKTKIDVHRAVVLSILLNSCETWTIYRRHIHSLDKFHLRCLRQTTGIKWQDKIPNMEVLEHCKMTGIEAMLVQAQLRWLGHLVCMSDTRFLRPSSTANLPLEADHVVIHLDGIKMH